MGTATSQNNPERLHVRNNLYLFSQANNYCCGKAVQRQLSKFTQKNTVTSFKTLVKSHDLHELVLEKGWSEKFHKSHLKESLKKSFFSYAATCNLTEQELYRSIFQISCSVKHL